MGTLPSKIKANKRSHSIRRRKGNKNEENQEDNKENDNEHVNNKTNLSTTTTKQFPNTTSHIDYLHHHHFVVKSIWSSNFSSPIEDKMIQGRSKILDVG